MIYIGEYVSVIAVAKREGWLAPLCEVHAWPCTKTEAQAILRETIGLPANMRVLFGDRRGRARYNRARNRYGLSLPSLPGGRAGRLRVGVVLHEAAHIWQHRLHKAFNHGPTFCQAFHSIIVGTPWREHLMPAISLSKIYENHRGPFSFMITKVVTVKGQPLQQTGYIEKALGGRDAHQKGIDLVSDPTNDVIDAFAYSETEGQFIGAMYRRGVEYASWEADHANWEALENVDLRDARSAQPLVRGNDDEPVQSGAEAGIVGGEPESEPAESVRSVPAKAARTPGVAARPIGTKRVGTSLVLGNGEWPPSAPAQLIKAFFVAPETRATSGELAAALGAQLNALGVGHPASLISRLKQNGLLKEAV